MRYMLYKLSFNARDEKKEEKHINNWIHYTWTIHTGESNTGVLPNRESDNVTISRKSTRGIRTRLSKCMIGSRRSGLE